MALSVSMAGLWRQSDLVMQAAQLHQCLADALLELCLSTAGLRCFGQDSGLAGQGRALSARLPPVGTAGAVFEPDGPVLLEQELP